MIKTLKVLISAMMLTSALFASSGDDMKLNIIDMKKAKGMYNAKSALFMDARGFKLYQKGTIMRAMHVPNKKFSKVKKFLPAKKNVKIVSFCNGYKCEESDHLAVKLMKLGYTKVYVYKGGYPEWKENKLPTMSLTKECKSAAAGPYKADEKRKVSINGAEVYWGGEAQEDGMIDQFWFETIVLDKLPANIQLVDVRKKAQYDEGHIKGALNISYDADTNKIDHAQFPKGKLIVFYCNTGMMSTDARNSLPADIAKNVLIFDANVKCEGEKCTVKANENL